MKIFNTYSKYYDLLYNDKNYKEEVEYIHELIQKENPKVESILNFGCGTGTHDFLLSDKGYSLTGVDISDSMIEIAKSKIANFSKVDISFLQGDIRKTRLRQKFDVVTSLFHVMSYQTSNLDLENSFKTASEHLNSEGLFIFDFWYGPAVLNEMPSVRIKRLKNDKISVMRIAEPTVYPNSNKVEVNFEVQIVERSDQKSKILRESHEMRYFFLPELDFFMKKTGFTLINSYEWLTFHDPSINSWYVVIVCKKI